MECEFSEYACSLFKSHMNSELRISNYLEVVRVAHSLTLFLTLFLISSEFRVYRYGIAIPRSLI